MNMKKSTYIIWGVVALIVIWVFVSYNGLVSLNEQADAQWAKVETQYQRRLDFIPNLVNSVKGILTQEQKVFGDIAAARTQYSGAVTPDQKAAAATQVESSLGRLIAVVENYPQLASSQNITELMTELEGTENRVSVERTRYNDNIQAYNIAIKTFPRNIVAPLFGFHERAYFQAATGASVAPTVNLQ